MNGRKDKYYKKIMGMFSFCLLVIITGNIIHYHKNMDNLCYQKDYSIIPEGENPYEKIDIISNSKLEKDKEGLEYEQDSYFLPRIYQSATPAVIVSSMEEPGISPILLDYFRKPALFFIQQIADLGIKTQIFKRIKRIILEDSNYQDFEIGMFKNIIIDKKSSVDILKDGIYELWIDTAGISRSKSLDIQNILEIKVDGATVQVKPLILDFQKEIGRYFMIRNVFLKIGNHKFEIVHNIERIKIMLLNKQEREIQQKIFQKKVNKYKKDFLYIFTNSGKFFVPQDAGYNIKPNVLLLPVRLKEVGYEIKFDEEDKLEKWHFKPSYISYDFSITKFKTLILSLYFDGDELEDEYLQMVNRDIRVDLKKYPYFDLTYKIDNPNVQTIEVVAGIDFDRDGIVDGYIRGIYPKPALVVWNVFSYDIYMRVMQDFPSEAYYDLIQLEVYPHKFWKTDCSSEKRGLYSFWIKDIKFYNYSQEMFFPDTNIALDADMTSQEEVTEWTINKNFEDYSLESGDNGLLLLSPVSYLELTRMTNGIDLKQFSIIELVYDIAVYNYLSFELFLDLDFDGDKIIDKNILVDYFPLYKDKFEINAYEYIKNLYPDEKIYNLIGIRFKLKDIELLNRFNIFFKRLTVQSQRLINPVDFIFKEDIFSIDGDKYQFYKEFKDDIKIEDITFEKTIYLSKGEHYLNMLRGNSFKLKHCIIEQENSKRLLSLEERSEPKITFKQINPTKYKIIVNGAAKPFFLVFSESFHGGWRIYHAQAGEKDQNPEKIIDVYPRLGVKEAMHEVRFTPGDIKYLIKKNMDVEHFEINSYANGWLIDPERLNLPKDFTLVLYFWPQSLFYLGLGISGLISICCFIVFIGLVVLKRKQRKIGG